MSSALEQKKAAVSKLSEKLGGAKAFYLTDFTGLNVQKMTDLRARMRAVVSSRSNSVSKSLSWSACSASTSPIL